MEVHEGEEVVAQYLSEDPRLYTDEERDRLAAKEGLTREALDKRLAILAKNWEDLDHDHDEISPEDRVRALELRAERRRKLGW